MGNISEFIKNNPKLAESYAIEAQEYLKENKIPLFETRAELASFLAAKNLSAELDKLWAGIQIRETLSTVKPQEPETPEQTQEKEGSLLSLALLPLSFFGARGLKIMEDDTRFKKIEEGLKEEWVKNNPDKTLESSEWLDYRCGNLDNPDAPTLHDDAEKAFRQIYPKEAAYYDKQAKKILKTPDEDSAIARTKRDIDEHIKARKAYFEKNGFEGDWDDFQKKIKDREWDRFLKRYKIKAYKYRERLGKDSREKLPDLDRALDRLVIKKQLEAYTARTGKEIKYVEKEKREVPRVSVQEATKRLEELLKKTEEKATSKVSATLSRDSRAAMGRARIPFSKAGKYVSSFGQRGMGLAGQGAQRLAGAGIRGTEAGLRTAMSGMRLAFSAVRIIPLIGATPVGWIAAGIGIVLLLIIIIIFFFGPGSPSIPFLTVGGGLGSGGPGPNGGSGGGSIANCTFYRGGDVVPGLKFGNPEMARFVESVSAKVGVPAAVVAGIMRVESGSKLARQDPAYFASDYDPQPSYTNEAFGLMQFTPGTFTGTFSRNASELNNLFNKTDVRAEIDPPDNVYPSNYLRIYSIKDSIIATAFKVKNDKQSINGDGPWDQATVYEIARYYYGCLRYGPGDCSSGPYNYGEDVWQSYSNCKVTPVTELAITCPLDPIGNTAFVTCGTATNPVNLCGHGGIGYPECSSPPYAACPYSEQLKNAIDIVSKSGNGSNVPVYLPTIGGNAVQWKFVKSEFLNAGWGFRQIYNSQFNGHSIDLELTHLNEQPPPSFNPINSGSQVGTTHVIAAHLHTGVVIDGRPVDPISDLFMCTQ